MSLLSRIAESFRAATAMPPTNLVRVDPRSLSVRGVVDPARRPEWMTPRTADWAPWDDRGKLADAVGKVTAVFACATYLADAVAESPLLVYREAPDGEPEEATDRVGTLCRDLLASPNPHTSESEFFLSLVLSMAVCGYGVVEKVRPKTGIDLPVELWTLRPDWLVRSQRATSAERAWQYRTPDGRSRDVPDRDLVIVPYYPDPWRQSYGVSPAQVAAREVGIDSSLTDFLKTFLDSNGVPPYVLTHPDPIWDEAEIAAMQDKWRQRFGGARAYGNIAFLHGGWQIQQVGDGVEAMAWPDLRGLTEQKIAQAHRVPLELIQGAMALDSGPLTSTQFEGAMAVLQRYAAAPLRSRIDACLSRGVLAEFTGGDPAYQLAFDTSGILALQEDHDALHERVRADWQAGLITLDEARHDLGFAELPNGAGAVFLVAFSSALTPAEALAGVPATPTTTTTPAPVKSTRVYRDERAMTDAACDLRASSMGRARRDRQKLEEIGARALRKFFAEQGDRVVASSAAGDPLDWDEETRALAGVLLRFYHANGEAAFATITDLLGVSIDWTLANPNIQRVVHDLGRRIVAISEQTRQDVVATIDAGLREGVSMPELGDRLSTLFTETYRTRAVTVARTESQVAYNRASLVGYAETGQVQSVELLDNPAHDTDPGSDGLTCAERNGLIVGLVQAQTHIAAEHPNGTLAVSPVLITPLGS